MRNDQVIQIRLPQELKEAAKERAEREGINLSEFLRDVLESYINELGQDTEPDAPVLR